MDQSLLYRSVLRVSAAVTALVLLFQSGMIDERATLMFHETSHQLGAMVGMSASVEPNELNSLTAELTKQQQLLSQREDVIAEREIQLGISDNAASNAETTTYILASILFVQLLLIILNYGLDYLRTKELREIETHSAA